MKKQDLERVVAFHKNVITQFIIKPQEINEIYQLVEPQGTLLQPYFKKQRAITLFVQGLQQQVVDGLEELFDEVEAIPDTDNPMSKNYIPKDSAASPATKDESQSHTEESLDGDTEDDMPPLSEEELEIPLVFNKDKAALINLEADLDAALNYEGDESEAEVKKTIRILKMKITKLKKKIDGTVSK